MLAKEILARTGASMSIFTRLGGAFTRVAKDGLKVRKAKESRAERSTSDVLSDLKRYIARVYTGDGGSFAAADQMYAATLDGAVGSAPRSRGAAGSSPGPRDAARDPSPDLGRSLAERLENLDESFAQTVLRLIDERGMTDVEVYKRANMSRQLFAKIRRDDGYRPTKRTACALAFALGLNHEDALALLERAGFTLSHSSKFDVIVEFFLVRGIHDIFQVNEALYAFDQQLLG